MKTWNLRDLFFTVTVAGLALAWWMERRESASPRIAVSATLVDFGEVAANSNHLALFRIKNTGGAPLNYVQGETSNFLSVPEESGSILPGETADFRVDWRATGIPGTRYVGHVELDTSDPCQKAITLVVTARIE